MKYEEWEQTVPDAIKNDSLWKMNAYRLALLSADLGWKDVTRLIQDRRTVALADQLYRALGSISANLAEGYSRGTGKDRARFYEYALGSARESRDWYHKGWYVLGDHVVGHRVPLLTAIIRSLLAMVPQQRGRTLGEEGIAYQAHEDKMQTETIVGGDELEELLQNIPVPEAKK